MIHQGFWFCFLVRATAHNHKSVAHVTGALIVPLLKSQREALSFSAIELGETNQLRRQVDHLLRFSATPGERTRSSDHPSVMLYTEVKDRSWRTGRQGLPGNPGSRHRLTGTLFFFLLKHALH